MKLLLNPYVLLALAVAFAGSNWFSYSRGKTNGYNKCTVEHVAARAASQAVLDKRAKDSADITDALARDIVITMPAIELTTNESADKVRIIYRDHPVQCIRPDGVQQELDKARQRANAAASEL